MKFLSVRVAWGLSLVSLLLGLGIFRVLLAEAQVPLHEEACFIAMKTSDRVAVKARISRTVQPHESTPYTASAHPTQCNSCEMLKSCAGRSDCGSTRDKGNRAAGQAHSDNSVRAELNDRSGQGLPLGIASALATAPVAAPTGKTTTPSISPKLSLLCTWLGLVSTDAVGPYAGLQPDGRADAAFGLDLELSSYNTLTGFEIHTLELPQSTWSTNPAHRDAWGLAVVYQKAPSYLLNKADGSVRIGIEGRGRFYLYVADSNGVLRTAKRLRVVVHLADGSSFQQLVRMPATTQPVTVASAAKPQRAKGVVTCEFRGCIADMENTLTSRKNNGHLNGAFIMRLQADDKKLAKLEIKGTDGTVHWSSHPEPPAMFLGLALYPKTHTLINDKGGPLQVPISGSRTFYLYAADNGLLSYPSSVLTLEVTFTDKTTLTTSVIFRSLCPPPIRNRI
jgi:hypothetical protein